MPEKREGCKSIEGKREREAKGKDPKSWTPPIQKVKLLIGFVPSHLLGVS